HRLVLLLHQGPHRIGHARLADVLGVRGLRGLEDAPAVREEMRDDVRVPDARVLGLNVKHTSLVADVVVEAQKRGRCVHDGPAAAAAGPARPRGGPPAPAARRSDRAWPRTAPAWDGARGGAG